jgi:hypothetical protein
MLVHPNVLIHQLDLILRPPLSLVVLRTGRNSGDQVDVVRISLYELLYVFLDGKGRVEGGEEGEGRKRVEREGVLCVQRGSARWRKGEVEKSVPLPSYPVSIALCEEEKEERWRGPRGKRRKEGRRRGSWLSLLRWTW